MQKVDVLREAQTENPLGAGCPNQSLVPADCDRFIGEAEPPFRRFLHIAPGPKHITSTKVV